MRRKMIDNRCSLWDVNIQKFHIGNKTYVLEGAPDRGGSCFVYHAIKMVTVGDKTYEHKVLLKEFYPILDVDKSAGMERKKDGTVFVPEATKISEDYQSALRRFRESYGLMLELNKTDMGAETTSVPLDYMEDGGTYYIEEAFDSGRPFEELFADGGRGEFSLEKFFTIYLKCIETVSHLHKLGYLHLDFNPKNISYTYAGNVKLFDTDTFVKKDELDKVSVWRGTKGFSAPEIKGAAKSPEDAPELIGEWTDVYSLTQLLCWFLYGHPLEEHEVEEALEQLEGKIRESYEYHYPLCILSRSGLYKLKLFLRNNLRRKGTNRTQSTSELILEAEELQNVLFYRTEQDDRVPIDNFHESKKILSGYRQELSQLNECLAARSMYSKNVAVLTGADETEREKVARYYGTLNRLSYSDIVEIHCDDYSRLIEEIQMVGPKPESLVEIGSRGTLPILFLIFDEQNKNFIKTNEIRAINELINIRWCQVLIAGKYNRCMNRIDEFDENMKITTVELETFEPDVTLAEELPSELFSERKTKADKDKKILTGSWKKQASRGILGLLLIAAGFFFVTKANESVGPMIYMDTGLDTEVYSFNVLFNEGVWFHVLGAALIVLGVGIDVHCLFDFKTPYGWKYFIRQFRLAIVGFAAAVFSLTMPAYFAYSGRIASAWEELGVLQSILKYAVEVGGISVLTIWIYLAADYKKKRKLMIDLAAIVLYVISFAYVVAQTTATWSEWMLVCICLSAIYIGIGVIRE